MVVSKRSHEKCQSEINGALTFLLFKSNKKKDSKEQLILKQVLTKKIKAL